MDTQEIVRIVASNTARIDLPMLLWSEPYRLVVWGSSPSMVCGRAFAAKAFWWIFSCEDSSYCGNFYCSCVGKSVEIVARAKWYFAVVEPQVPAHFPIAPVMSYVCRHSVINVGTYYCAVCSISIWTTDANNELDSGSHNRGLSSNMQISCFRRAKNVNSCNISI